MKKPMILQYASAVAAVVVLCFFLTSCGLIGPDASVGIKETVEAYLDDISGGDFTDNEYESDYADDTAFADLEFADEAVKEIMEKGFTKIDYTIDDAKGSVKEEEGTCDVTITAVDVDEVLSSLGDATLDAETLMDAVKDKKAAMEEYEITLDLIYDDREEMWLVSDSEPLVEILAEPYLEITLGPSTGDPEGLIETFMTALAQGDAVTIDLISPYYDSTNFFDEDESVMKMIKAFYGKITYEFAGEPAISDTYADVNVSMTMPDIVAIVDQLSNDAEFMAGILKPYFLASIQGQDTTAADEQAALAYSVALTEKMSASGAPIITYDLLFSLESDQETKLWVISVVPAELYDINAEPSLSDDLYLQVSIVSLGMLLQEGSIDQATYDEKIAELNGISPATGTGTTLQSDITFRGWYDYSLGSYVTSYESSLTSVIEFDLDFYNEWPGMVIFYDYYNAGGTVLIKSSSESMQSGQYSVYLPLESEDGGLLPADTYRLVVYLEDGTVIADEVIDVYA